MSASKSFSAGQGAGNRRNRILPQTTAPTEIQRHAQTESQRHARIHGPIPVQASFSLPTYPFQSLPTPTGPSPYRFDLSQILTTEDIAAIQTAGDMTIHTVGDTGDYRGTQQDFVSGMMTADANSLPNTGKPAFLYHLGDVVYFAGDIDKYADNFYATYQNYPAFIVAISGNHDCQPDDPQDGPVDPNKVPFDGFVQNFMSTTPEVSGSIKTGAPRTQMDQPNVYWTLTTPFGTIIGLCSNVGETEGEIHADQQAWFVSELQAADPAKALIVTVHHPPFSGDVDHSGSSAVEVVLTNSFHAAGRYPEMVLSGHVHNYQRFTNIVTDASGNARQIPFIVAGAGGYTNLGKLQKVNGQYPSVPLTISSDLILETYNQTDFGFLRLTISPTQITGVYLSAPFSTDSAEVGQQNDAFTLDLTAHTVTTN
jgi:acid phosphatase type 7